MANHRRLMSGQCHIKNQTSAVERTMTEVGLNRFFNPIGSFQTGSFTTLVTQTETSAIVGHTRY